MMALTTEQIATVARRYYMRHVDNSFGHASHLVVDALKHAEKVANRVAGGSAGFHGVEGFVDPDLLYLNTGDTYALTVIAIPGPWDDYRFICASWGDIVEASDDEAGVDA